MNNIVVGKKLTDPDVMKPRTVDYQEIPVKINHRTTVIASGVNDIARVCNKYNVNEETRQGLREKYNVKF